MDAPIDSIAHKLKEIVKANCPEKEFIDFIRIDTPQMAEMFSSLEPLCFVTTGLRGVNKKVFCISKKGNRFFLGPGKGLPGGGPEIVIDPVPTVLWPLGVY